MLEKQKAENMNKWEEGLFLWIKRFNISKISIHFKLINAFKAIIIVVKTVIISQHLFQSRSVSVPD